ncbi:MAG: zf-HC2 domain-containing protein [Acidobacteria bacterium]|nr:zf-HC2 domain-containing protein [Acidobacteriota bacterium]
MKCRDFREIIDSYLSDELLTETNHGVLSHLEECATCRCEIEARREIRGRLKSAVIGSEVYRIEPAFEAKLRALVKRSRIGEGSGRSVYSFSKASWLAAAAGFIVVLTLGFFLVNQTDNKTTTAGVEPSVANLKPSNIVNIALGDHEHCAVRHQVGKSPMSLDQTTLQYRGLAKIIVPSLKPVLGDYDLVAAHACKYKETPFAHLVLKKDERILSVLITDSDGFDGIKDEEILKFSSSNPNYQIARFNIGERAIFVISDLDPAKNFEATQALFSPLKKHFAETADQAKTTLLTFY